MLRIGLIVALACSGCSSLLGIDELRLGDAGASDTNTMTGDGDPGDGSVPATIQIRGVAVDFEGTGTVKPSNVELRDLANTPIPTEIAIAADGSFELVVGTGGRGVEGYLVVTTADPLFRPTQEYFPIPLDRDVDLQVPIMNQSTANQIVQACGDATTSDGPIYFIFAQAPDGALLSGAEVTTTPNGQYCNTSLVRTNITDASGSIFAVGVPASPTTVTVVAGTKQASRVVTPQSQLPMMFVPIRVP